MALTKCKECGAEISTKDESCPKCGAKRPKPTSLSTWIIGGFLALVIFQCTMREERTASEQASMSPTQKQAQLDESVRSDAKWMCKEFVEKTLKAPSTAEFQSYNNFSASGTGEGPFQVSGYVDAENSFGAKIRTQFICELRRTGDNWQLENLSQTP